MRADLRGFQHPASRLRDLARWELDQAELVEAAAAARLAAAEATVAGTCQAIEACAGAMASVSSQQLGASMHGWFANRLLTFMKERTAQEGLRDEHRRELAACRQRCVALRQRLQGLEHVHERALEAYTAAQAAAQWRDLDDQVLVRTQWMAAVLHEEQDHANG